MIVSKQASLAHVEIIDIHASYPTLYQGISSPG